jgi:hypothetical protein
VVEAIAPCWGDEVHGEDQFRRVAAILHFFGDRHSHIGTTDVADLLRVEEGRVALSLGPTKKWCLSP